MRGTVVWVAGQHPTLTQRLEPLAALAHHFATIARGVLA